MKKLIAKVIVMVLSLVLMKAAYADSTPTLQVKVVGAGQNNNYFLCVSHGGCVSILAAEHGRKYPISPGDIDNIFMLNIANREMSTQPLPTSCGVAVKPNQTLTVSGNIVKTTSHGAHINNLHCSVVS